MRLKYSIGRFAAQNGARYLLLQSPRLTLDLMQGGLFGVVASVSKDILLDIIEKSVGSPQELCEDVSNSVINEGLSSVNNSFLLGILIVALQRVLRITPLPTR